MGNTYINETNTLMDLYNEALDKQTLKIDAVDLTEPKAIENIKELAYKYGGYKVEGNYILVETSLGALYRIKKELWSK